MEDVIYNNNGIYCLIAIYPCLKLYNWIAKLLVKNGQQFNNIYSSWINENLDESALSKLENSLNNYPLQLVDIDLSVEIVKRGLKYEIEFFNLIE